MKTDKKDYYNICSEWKEEDSDKVKVEKIKKEISTYIENGGNIPTYCMDRKYEEKELYGKKVYRTDELLKCISHDIVEIKDGIYCIKYYPFKIFGNNCFLTVLVFIWKNNTKKVFAVRGYDGMIIDGDIISIFSSQHDSYEIVHGRIDIDATTLQYRVRKAFGIDISKIKIGRWC